MRSAAYLKGTKPSLYGVFMLGDLVGGVHHVGAEHGPSPGLLLLLHALQQSLLPQIAEQAIKDVHFQLAQQRHQHLLNTRDTL